MGQSLLLLPKVAENVELDNRGRPRPKVGSRADRMHRATKMMVEKKYISDAQLKRRKRLSAAAAITTSTLSLGALGAKGAGAGMKALGSASKVPKHLRRVPGVDRAINKPRMAKIGGKIDDAAVPVSLVSGGIGGLSGYNYASIQNQEARRRNMSQVKKAYRPYNPEHNRHSRNQIEGNAMIGAGVGAAGGSGYYAQRALRHDTQKIKGKYGELQGRQTKHGQAIGHMKQLEENKREASRRYNAQVRFREKMNAPGSTATRGAKSTATQYGNTLKGHVNTAEGEIQTQRTHVKGLERGIEETKAGVKTLRKVRKISGAKAGGLALGAGGLVTGGFALRRYTGTKKGTSYSPRYRPGQNQG